MTKQNTIRIEKIEQLIKLYSKDIRQLCRKYYYIGGNEDDLFQEAMIGFLEAVKNFDTAKGDINSPAFAKFAMMCAKRQVIDAVRKANAQKNKALNTSISLQQTFSENETGFIYDIEDESNPNPEQKFIQVEAGEEALAKLTQSLSSYEMQVLKLFLEGKKYAEIAISVGKNEKSVENTLQRIRHKLK